MIYRQKIKEIVGFTLIEMMFVVLVLGIVIVHIGQTQQQKKQAILVERAAGDINSLEVALLNFYQTNQSWPASVPVLSPAYIPPSALCSPFIISSSAGGTCGNYAPYQGSSSNLQAPTYVISVQTTSPSIAKLLASKLQNSWITADSITNKLDVLNTALPSPSNAVVRQYGPPPAPPVTSTAAYQGWIVSAGVVSAANQTSSGVSTGNKPGSYINLANCPAGFESHLITAPIYYDTYGDEWAIHLAMTTNAENPGDQDDNALSSDSTKSIVFSTQYGNQTAYAVTVADRPITSHKEASDIRYLVNFLTICVPVPNGVSNWYVNFGDVNYLSDTQCSSAWWNFEKQRTTFIPQTNRNGPNCQLFDGKNDLTFKFTFYYQYTGTANGH